MVPCEAKDAINWLLQSFLFADKEVLEVLNASLLCHAYIVGPLYTREGRKAILSLRNIVTNLLALSGSFRIVSASFAFGAIFALKR